MRDNPEAGDSGVRPPEAPLGVGRCLVLCGVLVLALAKAVSADPRIVFASDRGRGWDIYVMDAFGRDVRNVTRANDARDVMPDWSSDGRQIAFISTRGGDGWPELYVMDADGARQERLTNSPAGSSIAWPKWSPDGRWIAFQRAGIDGSGIYLVSVDGNTERKVADGGHPAWSPDGRRIAFQGPGVGDADLYIVDLDTKAETRLTQHPDTEANPAWSPDGLDIVYVALEPRRRHLVLVGANGLGRRRLTDGPAFDAHPSWSPDASEIVFHASARGDPADPRAQVYVVTVGTGEVRSLTDEGESRYPSWLGPGGLAVSGLETRSSTWGRVKLFGAPAR